MAKLTITLDIPDLNSSLEDPDEWAQNVIHEYWAACETNKGPDWPRVDVVQARWESDTKGER